MEVNNRGYGPTPEESPPEVAPNPTKPTVTINRSQLTTLGVVVGLFILAGVITMFTSDGNSNTPGAKVAQAANKVGYQVDDTRQEFSEINQLALEAAPVPDARQANMSGGDAEPEPNPVLIRADGDAAPQDEDVTNPGLFDKARGLIGGDGPLKAVEPPTVNERARGMQAASGDVLTEHQVNADRLIDSWKPQFKAAEREHEALTVRIEDTRDLWTDYLEVQNEYINKVSDAGIKATMRADLEDDQRAFRLWDEKASEVQAQSDRAMTTLRDMDYMIEFQRNRADLRAVIGRESLEVSSEVTTLLENLDQFEMQTEALSAAISR